MKHLSKIVMVIFAAAAGITACKKAPLSSTETFLPTDKAFVKFAFLSPGMPSFMIKIDEQKINGGNISGSAGLFPSTTSSPDYVSINPKGNLKLAIPNLGTSNDSVVLFTQQLNLEPNKYFSVVLADTGSRRAMFALSDDMPIADSGFIHYRVVNAIPNAAINVIRIDSLNATATIVRDTIARNIAYQSSSGFLKVAIPPTSAAPLRFRIATTTGLNLFLSTPGVSNRRVITQYASGYAGGTGIYGPSLGNLLINR